MTKYPLKIIKPFEINGSLDKEHWDNLCSLKECKRGKEPKQSTQFGVLGDKDNLYFAFLVEDDYYKPLRGKYNSKLYLEEVVEIFIAVNNRNKYLEIEVSPNNTRFCGVINNKSPNKRQLKLLKNCIFESVVEKNNKGWSVEIVLNIDKLCDKLNIRHDNVNKIYFNAYRIDRPLNSEWELSALNPTGQEAFHHPNSFVELEA